MLTILQFSNIQKASNHKNYSIVTLNLYNNMQFQVLSPHLLMICMESAYKHVSFLHDPKGSPPHEACDVHRVGRYSILF